MSDPTATPVSLQEELRRLEEIVRRLEANELDVDAALELLVEGFGRLRTARERLQDAEVRIQRVLERADGTLELRNMKE
jgi:exodeoxyribonuclease VII small subunit